MSRSAVTHSRWCPRWESAVLAVFTAICARLAPTNQSNAQLGTTHDASYPRHASLLGSGKSAAHAGTIFAFMWEIVQKRRLSVTHERLDCTLPREPFLLPLQELVQKRRSSVTHERLVRDPPCSARSESNAITWIDLQKDQ